MSLAAEVGQVRSLHSLDLPSVERILATDPVASCFIAARVAVGGLDPWRMGGELLGFHDHGEIRSLLYVGANLIPFGTDARARAAFAERLRATGRRSSSIVGVREEVLDLWSRLSDRWGPAREVRAEQPLLVMDGAPVISPDPLVRRATAADLDALIPACIDMFTAEVGISPVAGGMSSAYRARVAEIVAAGRSFVRREGEEIVFKAEIGAATDLVCQVQGVWVDPAHRGRGHSLAGMAAVVQRAQEDIAPVVSLYVNDFNVPARRCYESVGFHQHGAFATILF